MHIFRFKQNEIEDVRRSLVAKNTRKKEGGELEDLGARGYEVLREADNRCVQMSAVGPTLTSLATSDERALEYSPAFLLRCITDAEAASVKLGSSAYAEVVTRNASTLLNDGHVASSIASIDKKVETICGITVLGKFDESTVAACQLKIACNILAHVLS